MIDTCILWGLLISTVALWLYNWSMTRELRRQSLKIQDLQRRQKLPEENRCHFCENSNDCPTFNTGAIYPCPYYKFKREGEA